MDIVVERGDITASSVDVIVTAANRSLAGGGGVDGAVHRAAGPRLLAAARELAPCSPGQAVITAAYDLQPAVQWIVHAVGPRCGVDEPAAELLAAAYRNALARCDDVKAESVAFPPLSTGAYGFPLLAACQISVGALMAAPTDVKVCRLVAFDSKTEKFWARALVENAR